MSDCRSLLFDPPCRNPVKSVPRGKAIWNANGGVVSVLLTHLLFLYFVFYSLFLILMQLTLLFLVVYGSTVSAPCCLVVLFHSKCFYVITRHSRSELARYLFYCMFLPAIRSLERKERRGICFTFAVLFVFLSTISRQPAGQFTPNFACGRTLVPNVSSPLLGVGGPRRAAKRGNEIFVTMGVNGEFLHFGSF